MGKKFRILSLDGGGLRGIIPVMILQELERRMGGKRIHEMFDMIAGTSTGGLITSAITLGDGKGGVKYSLDTIKDVYMNRGKEIFPQRSGFSNFIGKIKDLKSPKYSDAGIDKVLRELLGNARLTDCVKPVFITTYDMRKNKAVLFKSGHAVVNPGRNPELYDVCRATSAGPTYLPAYEFIYDGEPTICVDGGVYMNNPAVGALVEISKYHNTPPYNRPELEWNDICMLSIGTGHYTRDVTALDVKTWGQLDWVVPISDIMMHGVNQTTDYEARELLDKGNYMRLTIDIKDATKADMADSSDETRNYLISEVQQQLLGNATLMAELDTFIRQAEL